MTRKLPAYTGPRYTVRKANGTHHVFDNVYYGVVDAKPTHGGAQARADELNARPRPATRAARPAARRAA